MQLNHLDLQVPNVIETRDFFIHFLDFKLTSAPTSSVIAILQDRAGLVLVLQKIKNENERYPDGFHIGFYVEHKIEVDQRRDKFQQAGLQVSDIQSNKRGYFFYTQAPGGFLVEINAR